MSDARGGGGDSSATSEQPRSAARARPSPPALRAATSASIAASIASSTPSAARAPGSPSPGWCERAGSPVRGPRRRRSHSHLLPLLAYQRVIFDGVAREPHECILQRRLLRDQLVKHDSLSRRERPNLGAGKAVNLEHPGFGAAHGRLLG